MGSKYVNSRLLYILSGCAFGGYADEFIGFGREATGHRIGCSTARELGVWGRLDEDIYLISCVMEQISQDPQQLFSQRIGHDCKTL